LRRIGCLGARFLDSECRVDPQLCVSMGGRGIQSWTGES
jgi:hypothetical protein